MKSLHPDHFADLKHSGLTPETIAASGIYTVTPGDIGKKLGGGDHGVASLLAFPYPGCDGYERYKIFYEEGRSGPKYRQKKDTPNRLYLPPTLDQDGDGLLLVVEGEKKTLSLWQAGFQVVGLGGVWGWCAGGKGYRQPKENRSIPDLEKVNWKRPVTIVFDSDGHDNPMIRQAAFRLGRELSRRGAKVSILFVLPLEAQS
ncbi:MAG: DUF3854 domain-containing protein [Thermodesulfobacteriota bacterium]